MCSLGETERASEREAESEESPPGGYGHATIPSPPFSSWDLGHARTCTLHNLKGIGSGTRTAVDYIGSNIAITLTTDPPSMFLSMCVFGTSRWHNSYIVDRSSSLGPSRLKLMPGVCACLSKVSRGEWRRRDCSMAIPPGG